jgi:nucleoside-diphosphate-sugar epimerase
MKVLLTGGSGDLGRLLCTQLVARGDIPINLDVAGPGEPAGEYVNGSVLDRSLLESLLPSVNCVVHIAAWHGIHEFRREKDAFDFWNLNVTGTFTLLECCARANCSKFVFISSSSVDEWPGVYGHSKLLGEDLTRTYVARHGMEIITLRPRAFIPHWNRAVYANFAEWARWYWGGAVHIADVAQAVLKSIDTLKSTMHDPCPPLTIDGACEFSANDLAAWDAAGPGTTFRKHFGQEAYVCAVSNGLDPSVQPKILGYADAAKWIGYQPAYGFKNMIEELIRQPDMVSP